MLGAALFLHGDYPQAADALEIALRQNPDSFEARYNLGLTLEKLGRRDEAAEQYQLCLELVPHYAPARQRLEALLKE